MIAGTLGYQFGELRHYVAQPVHLALARDMAGNAAGILDVLVPVEHLPDRLGLRSHRIPHVHGEDQRVAAWIVLEDRLGRRIGENATVPVEIAVDADRKSVV